MSFLAKELNLLISKPQDEDVEINTRTKEFIEAIKNILKNICLYGNGFQTVPKCDAGKTNKPIFMDIPKEADLDELLKWLNYEKIPFDLMLEHRNGHLFMKRLRITPNDILSWIKQNG